jgi:signal transduction histidine kinase/ActR/RegA family two-component response regulator
MAVAASTADGLQRLERRLRRERTARIEAEAIAERSIRELYEQQRRARLLEAAATAANVSVSIEEALRETLAQICAFTDWPVGHVYLAEDTDGGRILRSARVWRRNAEIDCDTFVQATEKAVFASGVGLPGRVLASGKAAWAPDVTVDNNFPRIREARRCGLHGAFAFPVLVSSEVAAVVEFYCFQICDPDPVLLQTVEQIGAQLGRIIERSHAEQRLTAGNMALKRLFDEAEVQREAAEAASRAKSAFLAVTSHEIRTPLNAVLGLAYALRREPLTPPQQDLAQGVLDGGAMLLRLLNAVLDLSKIEAGKMTLDVAAFDLRHMGETLVKMWGATTSGASVRVRLDASGLPNPCVLMSDVGKVEQTLANLVSNAVKFSPAEGGVLIRLAAHPSQDGLRIRAEVIDDGPGVAPADRDRIFQPFEQTQAGRDAGGTGLGLSICAGNVQLLGGEIGADRSTDDRARFWFEFTAALADANDAAHAEAEPSAAVASEQPMRILAAEDNAANRKVLGLILNEFNVSLTLVEDGAAAVDAVRTAVFDLVLMDANMPVMDGVSAVQAIRALGGALTQLPIHMLTANVFEEDIRLYLAAGANGVLSKPINIQALLTVLNAVAEGQTPRATATG